MPLKQKMEIRGSADEETSFDIDPDYEFDAAQFFDFTRPETRSEEEEAELWFDSAPAYPPSPFTEKAHWGVPFSLKNFKKAKDLHHQQDGRPTISDTAAEDDAPVFRINPYKDDKDPPPRAGSKLQAQFPAWSISGYMNPTASWKAKQTHSEDLHFHRVLRSPTAVKDHKTSSHSSSSNDMQATQRQKLDTGYHQKINHVKPRSPLQHKVAKTEWTLGKPKITVPREFSLETARRALLHRSKNESNSIGQTTSNLQTSKARPSNHKVPSVLCKKKTTLQSVEVLKIPAAKHPPPVDLFKNLSINSETQPNSKYQFASTMSIEDSKGNMRLLLKQGREMPDVVSKEPMRSYVKQFQCGRDTGISDYRSLASFNRSLDIR